MVKTKKTPRENSPSETAIVSSAHLADTPNGWQMSELEYAMTMTYNAFSRWMTHCMASVGYKDFNPLDILILHNVNHRAKEKRLADVAFMLNVDDTHTVNYAIKKLVKEQTEGAGTAEPGKKAPGQPSKQPESKAPANDAAERIFYAALERGLSFKTTMGNVLTLTPPLITTQVQMDAALDILEACISAETRGANGSP